MESTAPWLVLALVYGGTTLLVSPASRVLGAPYGLRAGILGNALLWVLCAAALAIALAWQQLPLAALGLSNLAPASLVRAALLFALLRWIAVPLSLRVVSALGLGGFGAGIERLLALPLAYRVFAVITAGVVEETLFRAVALAELAELGASPLVAAVVSTLVFAILHGPFWGAGAVVSLTLTSAVLTLFFLWTNDLAANALAHSLTDASAFVIAPLQAERAARRSRVKSTR
ncbi:MAG: CPBP family intramembrane metalloprotease [Deltaproteobacteria bacterium]|nr:CPBP family intramembrane metalloprotease [Deltaproteobacteria bacterium]